MSQDPFARLAAGDEYSDEDGPNANGYISDTLYHGSRQPLGLSRNYVPGWKEPHALREFHQNWKDGIKSANRLGSRDFKVLVMGFNAKNVYQAEARHPDTNALLGFISWENGTVRYCNFKAQLSRSSLELGSSTKRNDDNLAGTHGEGFKVASLVMLRQGYCVRYEASEFYWSFSFAGKGKNQLYCRLTTKKAKELEKLVTRFNAKVARGTPRELKGNIWEDVTVSIGKVGNKGRKVDKDDFLAWITVSLDLDSPSSVIATTHGSLILEERFSNRLYLKGLRLESEGGLPYKFCYNFSYGSVNRDRERLISQEEESQILAKIWAEAIKHDQPSALTQYMEMLQSRNNWPDVNLAENHISEATAKTLWKRLQDDNAGGGRFYYFEKDGGESVMLISKSLQKEPAPLPKALWKPLRKYQLVRTPQEQRNFLLQSAPETEMAETLYAIDVIRALSAVMAVDVRTRHLSLDFRSHAAAEVDLLLQGTSLLINDKWLDFELSHSESSCSAFLEAHAATITIDRFSCTHVVEHLYDLVLMELPKTVISPNDDRPTSDKKLRQLISERIGQMPRMVSMEKGDTGGVLKVRWVHTESDRLARLHNLVVKGRITLHKESTCAEKKLELLSSDVRDKTSGLHSDQLPESVTQSQGQYDCGCPEKIVALKDSEATFVNLSHTELYFPMVTRTESLAFFAQPPESLSPNAPVSIDNHLSSPAGLYVSSTPSKNPVGNARRGASHPEEAPNDLCDVSDSDDDLDDMTAEQPRGLASNLIEDDHLASGASLEYLRSAVSPNVSISSAQEAGEASVSSVNPQSLLEKTLAVKLETQEQLVRTKDQKIQDLEAEAINKNNEYAVQIPKLKQLEHDLITLNEILQVKNEELADLQCQMATQKQKLEGYKSQTKMHEAANAELVKLRHQTAAQSKDLGVKIAALKADKQHRDQYTAEAARLRALVERLENTLHAREQSLGDSALELTRLQTAVDSLSGEVHRKDTEAAELLAKQSPAATPGGGGVVKAQVKRLQQQIRVITKEKKELQSDLEQAQEEVRKALEIASSAASRVSKRPRIKEEIKEEDDDYSDPFDGTRKRARYDDILAAKSNAQGIIELD